MYEVTRRSAALLLVLILAFVPVAGSGAHGKPGTKKFCRHHKKKCRKNVRNKRGHIKVRFKGWGVGAGWSPTNTDVSGDKVYFDVTLQTGRDPVVTYTTEDGDDLNYGCPNNGDNEYWVCNGHQSFKKGKATLRTVSHAYGNLFDDLLYRTWHKTEWRWRKGRIRSLSQARGGEQVTWYVSNEGPLSGSLGKPWYRWFKSIRRSGHRKQYGYNMRSCFGPAGFCFNFRPYSRHYVHGDGTFHASGNNW